MPPKSNISTLFGRGSDLRNKTSFPPVVDCPDENELDLRYYSDYGGSPTRHWCLLAEVVEYTFLGRLVCEVRDIQGKDSRVAFYDDERGIQFVEGSGSKTKCKIGYTVAVLYPSGHGFLDMSYGFRVEEQSIVRFFPCTLKQLYSANEMIRSPSVPVKTCSALGCDKVENLQACSACHAVQYCGKDHQLSHWKEHKGECKAIVALGWFTARNWTRFSDWFSF